MNDIARASAKKLERPNPNPQIANLFKLTMEKKWKEISELYGEHESVRRDKITVDENTALHVAILSYNPSKDEDTGKWIKKMIKHMSVENLKIKNSEGETPLHLAAAAECADICRSIVKKKWELIKERNKKNETPLFVAAHYGKIEAFICLRDKINDEGIGYSLCRRKDGKTALHSALYGENFELANEIIDSYPKLVNDNNIDGESPLHVLANKPAIFKNVTDLRYLDLLIYKFALVELQQGLEKITLRTDEDFEFPQNYRTCVNIFKFFWFPLHSIIRASIGGEDKQQNADQKDEESLVGGDKGSQGSTGTGRGGKQHNNDPKDDENKLEKGKGSQETRSTNGVPPKQKEHHSFPANYNTLILLLKFAVNFILTVVGVGLGKIKDIKQQKEKYEETHEIIKKILKDDSSYKYVNNGKEPVETMMSSQRIRPPMMPPRDPKQGDPKPGPGEQPLTKAPRDMDSPSQEKNPQEPHTLAKADTPFLLAAKNGITDMVEIILEKSHICIYDRDFKGRNALMLAAEHRQMKVFDKLLKRIPKREFQRVDDEGNNIIHLAAKLEEHNKPTRIPGPALQMQWEMKWFEHVKDSVPSICFTHYINKKGETPQEIFAHTHKSLMENGNAWLIKTSESCSVIAALIAGSAFATSSSVPGGVNENTGRPLLEGEVAFDVFSISSLIGLCLAVTALVFFLAIITSRGEEKDFKQNLPYKLLGGLTCLFVSIVAMLVTYCAGHTFLLKDQLKFAEIPIYAIACVPVSLYAFAQLELYADLVRAVCAKKPLSRDRI